MSEKPYISQLNEIGNYIQMIKEYECDETQFYYEGKIYPETEKQLIADGYQIYFDSNFNFTNISWKNERP
jgi:hypothetical protein